MNEIRVLTFLTDTERILVVTLLEDRLRTLTETLRGSEDAQEERVIQEQIVMVSTLLNKLHSTHAVHRGKQTPVKHNTQG
jgi:hypothetical protein